MTKKNTRANITARGKAKIGEMALAYPRDTREKTAERIRAELGAMGEDMPELEVLWRKISEWRKGYKFNSKDSPWSVVTMASDPVEPEALLIVLKAWARELDKGFYLSIREAKWISRLYGVFPYLPELIKVSHFNYYLFDPDDAVTLKAVDVETAILDDIISTAREYANQERAIEATGKDPGKGQDATMGAWLRDAGLYGKITGDYGPAEKRLGLLKSMRKMNKGGK